MPSPFELRVSVADRWKHSMSIMDNPFCTKCWYRTFPIWGPHACEPNPDPRRMRHLAGDILSNMHFYRVPAEMQIAALAEALAYTLATNVHPEMVETKWRALQPKLYSAMMDQVTRIIGGTNLANVVMDVNRKRSLKVKRAKPIKKKGRRA